MNIFYLHYLAKKCAKLHFDKHVNKMALETMQLLSGVWWMLCPEKAKELNKQDKIYKLSHKNHPCAKWARESRSNYVWLAEFGMELCKEYKYRYGYGDGYEHASQEKIQWAMENIPSLELLPEIGMTKPAQAMPDECKMEDPIDAYRKLYQSKHKRYMSGWTKRERPDWFSEEAYQLGVAEKKAMDEERKLERDRKKSRQ